MSFNCIWVSGNRLLHMSKIVEFGARIANAGINHSTAGDIFRWQLRFGYHAVYTQTLVVESYARRIVKSGAVRCNA